MSSFCVDKLDLLVKELPFEFLVSTPTSGKILTLVVFSECSNVAEERIFKVNLICLPLQELDVILGMNWLSANHILIDCGQQKVVFLDFKELKLIYA